MALNNALVFENVSIEVPWGYIVGRWYGNRKVRPILAIHGWQDNIGTWDRLIPLLPKHIGILCIDLPGHGRSSKYPPGMTYHMLDYVQIVVRIVKEYKWRKVSLMGHSMGASICFFYTALFPHMVDMIIQIDMVKPKYNDMDRQIEKLKILAEKSMIENERLLENSLKEPPTYSYQQLEELWYNGSWKSVEKENCKYLLNRSVEKSQLYPEKYYFSRDGRVKFYVEISGEQGLGKEMAKRIKNLAYMIVRSNKKSLIDDAKDEEIIDILRINNAHFEYHRLNGTHHLHLNDAEEIPSPVIGHLVDG
ncbi:hypothetical protein DOY81_009481 [Sarcophaga bullata]|nr:hypothetical protein DOY81_009481 [Sarcophaga bullata]